MNQLKLCLDKSQVISDFVILRIRNEWSSGKLLIIKESPPCLKNMSYWKDFRKKTFVTHSALRYLFLLIFISSVKKGVLRNFAKFTAKHLWKKLFLINLRALGKIFEISKNTFLQNTSGGCFWTMIPAGNNT